MAKKKQNNKEMPKVNPELEGFDIKIDSFGEIKTNFNIDKINEFLNKNVDDKKLRDRNDLYIEEKHEEDLLDEELLIKSQFEDTIEETFDNEETDEEIEADEDLLNDDGFDDFTIEDDDMK
ncbi:MAG: hypothetical protein M3512_13395 [Bacteroidota bacterium]|nr:hypothetical protein [Bacteroidota bacterium]MDQ3534493.1 hypothetical protein [Bacteroidota bacterium]